MASGCPLRPLRRGGSAPGERGGRGAAEDRRPIPVPDAPDAEVPFPGESRVAKASETSLFLSLA